MPPATSTYPIGRPTGQCAATLQQIPPASHYIAALTEPPPTPDAPDDTPTLQRVDVSAEAWNNGFRPPHLFAHWQATMREPSADDHTLNTDNLLELFDTLDEQNQSEPSPRRSAFRHVLALLLIRKRLLVQHDPPANSDNPSKAIFITRKTDPHDTPPTPVEEPILDAETLSNLTTQLRSLIDA